jgi:hypothetical protein
VRPDRSKVVDLFESDVEEIFNPNRKPVKSKSKSTGKANDTNKEKFMLKLAEEQYHEFDYKDWFHYFVYKASMQNVRYITRNYAKEYAILKSIMGDVYTELKDMIDLCLIVHKIWWRKKP